MVTMWGDIAFTATTAGINVFLLFFLLMTKWYKSFMTISIVVFFTVTAIILDMGVVRVMIPETKDFLESYVRTPLYMLLAVSVWSMLVAAVRIQFLPRRRPKVSRFEVDIPK